MSINFTKYTTKALRKLFKRYMHVKDPDKAHAVLSASGSERWLGCPGSIRMSEGIKGVDTEWSIAGTHAHTLLQFILENFHTHQMMLKSEGANEFKKFIAYSPEQYASVMVAVNYVRSEMARMEKANRVKPTLLIEQKVELRGVGFGTADIILFQPFGVLHVIDYKNGQSAVSAIENTQGLYYAHAAADEYGWDFREVWITIIQPNASHKEGPVRTWKTTIPRLEEAGKRFRIGAIKTRKRDAPLVMDAKWCWFCPARPKCPKQMEIKTKNIMDRFTKPEPKRGSYGQEESEKESSNQKARGQKAASKKKSFCDAF